MRAALATGIAAVVLGVLNMVGRYERAYDVRDRETPKSWLDGGVVRWSVLNGMTLGLGLTSRIGYWLWYVVPIMCLLAGRPISGAVVYGLYGLTRAGIGPMALVAIMSKLNSWEFVARVTAMPRRLLVLKGVALSGVGVGLFSLLL